MSCLLGKDELTLCRQVRHGAQIALSVRHLGPLRASGLVSNQAGKRAVIKSFSASLAASRIHAAAYREASRLHIYASAALDSNVRFCRCGRGFAGAE
jgi:hypothetical protein